MSHNATTVEEIKIDVNASIHLLKEENSKDKQIINK
jgi:hypothetical protein